MRNKILALLTVLVAASCAPKDGIHHLTILTTDDVHGAWFDSLYVGEKTRPSLFAVNTYVDSVRAADGAENVLLLDAGDCLQGDNAPYYYNYVDTTSEHLFVRLVDYMGYDAIAVGNHDVETAHHVYDRVTKQLAKHGIPYMAGNAIRNDNGKPYWVNHKVFKRAGLKILVLGYTNPDMASWLAPEIWSGMHFENLIPLVQQDVDKYKAQYKPDVTIVMAHSATGEGDGSILESQGKDLYNSLHGVDFIVCAHDHRQTAFYNDTTAFINAGNRSKYIGYGSLDLEIKNGKVASKKISSDIITVDKTKVDTAMRAAFRNEYETVKAFTVREVGHLAMDMYTRDAYRGMSDYINLVHIVQLKSTGAQISFAAPLTYNGKIPAGTLLYNDMFTIYPYENQIYKLKMSGKQVKDFMEFSYGLWLAEPGSDHVLRVIKRDDPRNNQASWSFEKRSYNFDSAAGLKYTVDVTKPEGERVNIISMADGTPFDENAEYTVAMTSYRANGGGDTLNKGAGIAKEDVESHIIQRYPEIREFIYQFIEENKDITHDLISNESVIGEWHFIPESSKAGIEKDMALLFRNY